MPRLSLLPRTGLEYDLAMEKFPMPQHDVECYGGVKNFYPQGEIADETADICVCGNVVA